jgi:hypothetical protein
MNNKKTNTKINKISFRCDYNDIKYIEKLKEEQGIKNTSELIRRCIYTCYDDILRGGLYE